MATRADRDLLVPKSAKVLGLTLGAVAALVLFASTAHADDRYRVVLLQPETSTRFSAEVVARVRGELEATNFELNVISAPEGLSPKEAVETAGAELNPNAVLLVDSRVDRELKKRSTDVWLSDRVANKTFVQRLNVELDDAEHGATWVAVQAVELVRARLADSSIHSKPVTSEPVVTLEVVEPRPSPAKESENVFAAGVGLGVLHGFQGRLGATLAPVVRVSAKVPTRALGEAPLSLHLRVSASGFGTASSVERDERSADVKQSFGTLDAMVRFGPRLVVQPLLSLGGGAYLVDVRGSASAPYSNNNQLTWSGLGSAGAGIWTEPVNGIACVLEAQLLAAWSKTIVRLGEQKVVEAGSPMGFFSAGILGVF